MSEVRGIDPAQLLENIEQSYSLEELTLLAFRLNIDFENLPGQGKEARIMEFIRYCQRRGRLLDLVKQCEKERPHLQWFHKLQPQSASFDTVEDRIRHRDRLYEQADGIQLVHTILPSKQQQGHWDILIFLIRHQSDDLSIVDHAEFFLGKYWDNQIFHAANSEGFIGIAISAYGPALCTCRVVLYDGRAVMLSRYIDFEMAHLFDPPPGNSQATPESPASKEMSPVQIKALSELMVEHFTEGELELTVRELGGNLYEIVPPGAGQQRRVRELVLYYQRHAKLPSLIQQLRQRLPEAPWDDVLN
jgi:hypothetical protein